MFLVGDEKKTLAKRSADQWAVVREYGIISWIDLGVLKMCAWELFGEKYKENVKTEGQSKTDKKTIPCTFDGVERDAKVIKLIGSKAKRTWFRKIH